MKEQPVTIRELQAANRALVSALRARATANRRQKAADQRVKEAREHIKRLLAFTQPAEAGPAICQECQHALGTTTECFECSAVRVEPVTP